jgi:hypothetical protein
VSPDREEERVSSAFAGGKGEGNADEEDNANEEDEET